METLVTADQNILGHHSGNTCNMYEQRHHAHVAVRLLSMCHQTNVTVRLYVTKDM